MKVNLKEGWVFKIFLKGKVQIFSIKMEILVKYGGFKKGVTLSVISIPTNPFQSFLFLS